VILQPENGPNALGFTLQKLIGRGGFGNVYLGEYRLCHRAALAVSLTRIPALGASLGRSFMLFACTQLALHFNGVVYLLCLCLTQANGRGSVLQLKLSLAAQSKGRLYSTQPYPVAVPLRLGISTFEVTPE
jgi:serine/threonine protein kinase